MDKKKIFEIIIPGIAFAIFGVIIPVLIPDLAMWLGFGPKSFVLIYTVLCLVILLVIDVLCYSADSEAVLAIVGALTALFIGFCSYGSKYSELSVDVSSMEIDGKTVIFDPPRHVDFIVKDSDLREAALKALGQKSKQ